MSPEVMQIIQDSLDLIEENLHGIITPRELADTAGFSLSHYYHVFEAVMGVSVGRYITRRRLLHAAWDMHQGKDAFSAALDYGFDTHAGFYKAFRKEFGCGPSRFSRTHCAARPARVNLKEVPRMTDIKTIARALEAWGMENETISPIYYANTGNRSESTFAVGAQHCIKISASPGELTRQALLIRAMAAEELSPPLCPTADGQDVLLLDGFDFMLLRRAQGKPVNAMDLLERPEAACAIGEGLARLHKALRACDPALCHQEDLAATLQHWAIPAVQAAGLNDPWLGDFQARMAGSFSTLPMQIIHRDPNPDNLLMENGRVTGFLDFDLTRILPRIYDVCYAATGILSTAWNRADEATLQHFFDLCKNVWQGYDAVSSLTEAEWRALPDMVLAIQLICVAAFVGSDKYAHLYEVNRQMLAFIVQHLDRF